MYCCMIAQAAFLCVQGGSRPGFIEVFSDVGECLEVGLGVSRCGVVSSDEKVDLVPPKL